MCAKQVCRFVCEFGTFDEGENHSFLLTGVECSGLDELGFVLNEQLTEIKRRYTKVTFIDANIFASTIVKNYINRE